MDFYRGRSRGLPLSKQSTLSAVSPVSRLLCAALATLCMLAWPARAAQPNHSIEMSPVAAGPYPVACSNIAQDSVRVAQLGIPIDDFWTGADDHYIGDILLEPADTLVARPRVPDDDLYPLRRNSAVEFVVITCYPTAAGNQRPDYPLADGVVIPHMQRMGDAPIFAAQPCIAIFPVPANCGRFPLVVFSHGLAGSPIDGKSIDFLVRLASNGYIVTAPFHGDKRFSRVKIEDFLDLVYIAFNFERVVELEAMRPLSHRSEPNARRRFEPVHLERAHSAARHVRAGRPPSRGSRAGGGDQPYRKRSPPHSRSRLCACGCR